MTDFVRRCLEENNCISVLHSTLECKKELIFAAGQERRIEEVFIVSDRMSKYILAEDVPRVIAATREILGSLDPLRDKADVVHAFDVAELKRLSMHRLRLPPVQAELHAPEGDVCLDQVKPQTSEAKKAVKVAREVIAQAELGSLSGESYLELMRSSPDHRYTRAVIKRAKRGGVAVATNEFNICSTKRVDFPKEVACQRSYSAVLSLLDCSGTGPGRLTVKVVKSIGDEVFWRTIGRHSFELEVTDEVAFKEMRIAYATECQVTCSLAISITPDLTVVGADEIRASLIRAELQREMVDSQYRQMCSQLSWDF